MEEFEYLLEKCGFIKKPRIQNNFLDLENLVGFKMPDDYKYYLNNYEPFEGFIGQEYIALYEIDELLVLNITDEIDYHQSKIISIGSNGASENIGIKPINDNNYRIVIAQYIRDVDDHIEIGLSFTDMLKRLNEGLTWFDN
jgi:hypothetical protein